MCRLLWTTCVAQIEEAYLEFPRTLFNSLSGFISICGKSCCTKPGSIETAREILDRNTCILFMRVGPRRLCLARFFLQTASAHTTSLSVIWRRRETSAFSAIRVTPCEFPHFHSMRRTSGADGHHSHCTVHVFEMTDVQGPPRPVNVYHLSLMPDGKYISEYIIVSSHEFVGEKVLPCIYYVRHIQSILRCTYKYIDIFRCMWRGGG